VVSRNTATGVSTTTIGGKSTELSIFERGLSSSSEEPNDDELVFVLRSGARTYGVGERPVEGSHELDLQVHGLRAPHPLLRKESRSSTAPLEVPNAPVSRSLVRHHWPLLVYTDMVGAANGWGFVPAFFLDIAAVE
jgi:hypothetical protein